MSAVAGNADDPVSRVTLNTSDVAPLDTTTASRPLLGVKTIDAVHIEPLRSRGHVLVPRRQPRKSLVSQTFDIQALMVFRLLSLALGVVWCILWRGSHFVKKARQRHVRAARCHAATRGPRGRRAPATPTSPSHLPPRSTAARVEHAFDGYVELILMELRSVTRLTLILFDPLPLLYYFMSFEPCFLAIFEAALVHATGQALGFGEVSDDAREHAARARHRD